MKKLQKLNPKVIIQLLDENSGVNIIPPITAEIKDDCWNAEFLAPAGGLYTLRTLLQHSAIRVLRGDIRSHIGVGDIFLIAGQSNAEGNGKNSIPDPVSDMVHVLKFSGKWDIASHPLHDSTDSKYSKFAMPGFHSPWLQFAKLLTDKLAYPIGLLPSALGGVGLSCWNKEEGAWLLNDMLDIVNSAGGKIKGVLWYQGCADAFTEPQRSTYLTRFNKVCADIRKALKADVPFFTVQLNKVTYLGDTSMDATAEEWAIVREAQRKAAKENEGVYVVPAIDLPVCDTIHNSSFSNIVIGERVACTALKYLYNKLIPCEAPDIERAVLKDSKTVCLYFNNVYGVLSTDYYFAEALPFAVKDANGKHFIKDYSLPGDNSFLLHFDEDIKLPATVGCTKYSDSGFAPYDLATRLPILMFNNISISEDNN